MYKLSKWKTTCIYVQVKKCLVMRTAISSVEKNTVVQQYVSL